MNSYVIKKERCPKCAAQGRDTSHDNLAIYSDGHKYCFSCGYFISNGLLRLKQGENKEEEKSIVLPYDSEYIYPKVALTWVEQYDLTNIDLLKHRVVWSEHYQRLIFPVFDKTGLIAYQGRYFGDSVDKRKRKKWWGTGDLKNIFHILGEGDIIICVEDIVSAVKLAKYGYKVCPLFGSHIGFHRFKRLSMLTNEVWIWLDPDKRKESLVEALRGQQIGLTTRSIYADKDPKECSEEEINFLLQKS